MDMELVREAARLVTDPTYHCPDCLLWRDDNFDIKLCWAECGIDRTIVKNLQEAVTNLLNKEPDKEYVKQNITQVNAKVFVQPEKNDNHVIKGIEI